MGDAQSAQREGKKDEAAEEESGKVEDAQAVQCTEDKPFKNSVQITEINEKAGISIAEVNGLCEDEVAADAVLSPDEDISETEIPLQDKEEAPKDEKESSNEVDVAQDVPLEMTEIDGKKNDINDGFRKFFSNIGLRLSIKRGSTDLLKGLPDETSNEEQCDEEPLEVVVKETESEIPAQNTDANTAQETLDNDSTTGPTMTDLTPEDVLENAEEKATEAKEETGSDDAGEQASPEVEEADQEATPEDELQDSPEQGEFVSPIKKFFTTGIFSGLRKKRKPAEEDTNEKEMIDMGKKDSVEVTEETEENQQLDKEQIDPGIEASADETEHKENGHKQEILSTTSPETTDEGKSSTTDPSTDIVPEPDNLNACEKEKVPASPLKRLLSGSSFRKLSKKPRSRRSSDSRLSDSGEHAADQLMSSTESAENQKEEGPTQPSSEATGEEDSAWASFKKLLTPKKRRRAPSLSNKETDTPAAADKPKPSEGEQISDQSTDEDKKRKDSSVSWEAVLCGSGKKRSRKTSDSEDETPPNDNNDNKQEVSSKPSAGPPEERSNERKNSLVSTTRVRSDGEGPTTWITFRRLVTPKRKAKEEDENKDSVQSDSEVSHEDSSFSIKKLLPGRKKRKSTEKQDHVSSDEADKDVPSGDEDSETPAVVPLSEFDTPESMIQIQTQAEIESHLLKGTDYEVPEDLHQLPEQVRSCEDVQNKGKIFEESEAEKPVITTPAKDKELDDDSDVISKHQQLSDITEEGIITETMATPASVNEEAGRDDTIAEDLMEMTSEAITAQEPASVTTLADETEMISAVSQLSTESSKTSGNTTPVPAEYEVMETDVLLHQVVETITTTPEAVPISSNTTKSENIVSSVLHQIFKTFVKDTRSEATAITTDEAVEELDEVKELAATAQTESIPEVNDSEPTEFLPETLEKFETAEVHVGEVHEVQQTNPELRESEASAEHVPEESASGEGSMVEASLELKDETQPQNEVQVQPEKVEELETIVAKAALELDAPINVQASKLDLDEESEELPEQEVISEDIQPAETMMDETEKKEDSFNLSFKGNETDNTQESEVLPSNVEDILIERNAEEDIFIDAREITQSVDEGSVLLPLSEGTFEQVDTSKTEDLATPTEESLEPMDSVTAKSAEAPEELETEQTRIFNTENSQQEMEISNEPENKKTPEDTVEGEQVKEPNELEAVQAPVVYLKDGSVQSLPEEVKLEDVPVSDELKEEPIYPTEDSFELLGAAKAEHVPEPEVFCTVQSSSELSMGNLPLPKEEKPEIMPSLESAIDEGKQKTEASVQPEDIQELEELPSNVEDTGIETSTEDFFTSVDEGNASLPTSEVTLEQVDDSKTEGIQEQKELQTLQPPPKDSQISNLLTLEKVIPEDIPAVVTDEPQKETEVRVEAQETLHNGGSLSENVDVAVVLLSEVEETAKDSSFDKPMVTESVDEDIAAVPSTGESLEPIQSFTAEQTEEPEEIQTVQTSLFNTEEPQQEVEFVDEDVEIVNVEEPEELPSVVKDVAEETSIDKDQAVPIPEITESIEEISTIVPPSERSLEPLDLSTTDVQAQEEPQTVQVSPLDLEGKIAEDIPSGIKIVEEIQKETEVRADAPEKIEIEADTTDSEDLPSAERDIVQETVSEECATMLVTEATDSTEGQRAPTTPTKTSPEPVNVSKTEDAHEGEVLNTKEGSLLESEDSSLLPLEKEASEVITVTDEPQKDTEARDEVPEASPLNVEDTVKEVRVEPLQQPQVENVQELEMMQSVVDGAVEETVGKDASIPVLEVTECINVDIKTVPVSGGSPESVDLSTREQNQVQEELGPIETVEALSMDSEICSLPLARPKIQDITALEKATDELKPITVVRVEADTTEEKQEPEEVNIKQEAESDPKASSLQLFKNVVSKDTPATETVTDEPQKEETEVIAEPEGELPVEAITTEYVQEQEEILSSVKDIDLDTSAEERTIIQEPVLTESTDEVFETTPHTAVSPEPVDVSRTEDVHEPQVCNTEQGLPLDLMEELVFDKVIPEDKPTVEIITDELQNKTDVRVEPQEIPPVEADTPGTEQEAQSDPKASDLTFENVISEDVPTVETVTDESQKANKETIEPVEEPPAEAFKSEIQEPEELLIYVEEVEREHLYKEGTTTEMLVATESITECNPEIPIPEESLELINALKTEQVQVQEEIPAVQDSPLDSKVESLLPLEKELPEHKPAMETVMKEPQKEICVTVEPQDQQSFEAEISENVQEPDALPSSVKDIIHETLTKEEATIHVSDAEEVVDGVKAITPPTEECPETVDASEMEDVQEPKVFNSSRGLKLDSEMSILIPIENVVSENIPAVETATDEPQKETDVQDEEPPPSGVGDTVKDIITEEGVFTDVDVVTKGPKSGSEQMPVVEESLELGGAHIPLPDGSLQLQSEKPSSDDFETDKTVNDDLIQEAEVKAEPQGEQPFEVSETENDQKASDGEDNTKETKTGEELSVGEEGVVEKLEEQISQEDVSKPDLDGAFAAIADHIESNVAAQLDQAVAVSEGHETESNQQGVEVEQDWTLKVAEELAIRPLGHVASLEDTQVLENTIISEETQAPSVDNAAMIDKSRHEVPLSAVQASVEGEEQNKDTSTETATLEHAIVPEVVTSFIKEVSATIPDVLPVETSDSADSVQDNVGQMMYVPSVECEDDHKIQVQVVDVNIKSVKTIVDEMLEVDVTEMKEVIEVHHEAVKEEDILLAPPDTEDGLTQEETQRTIEEVVHVKENLPETVSEPTVVLVEQAVILQLDAVDEVCELTNGDSVEKEHQEVMDDGSSTLKERQGEAPVVISDDLATSRQVSDVEQTLMLEETKAEEVKSEIGLTVGEVKPLSEESDFKKVHEPEQSTQSAQGPVATPSDTGLVVPQNTGIISSTGNSESPSSLSLELKLNIQFGQSKVQPPQSPITDRAEPVKQKDVSEVGVQAEVPLKPAEPTTLMQQAENQKNIDLAAVKDQPIGTAESVSILASTARSAITSHPVQMNLGIVTIETVESVTQPVSPPLSTERAEPAIEMDVSKIRVQAMGSVEPMTQRAESQKQTVITELEDHLTEISKPVPLQDLTKKTVTEPELWDITKAPALQPPDEGTDKLLEQLGGSNVAFDAGELIDPVNLINLPQEAERQIQTEQTDVSDQPTEITELEAILELTESSVITTQPEVMDSGTCASETEQPVADKKGSTHLQNEGSEQLKSTDISEVEPVKPANLSQRAESQFDPTEVNVHQTEITEHVTHSYKEATAMTMTEPVLWDLAIQTIETVESVPKEPASSLQVSAMVGALTEDVSKDEVVESVDQITQIAESQTGLTHADDQTEPEEPSSSAGGVLLDIGLQESEIEEPVSVAPSSQLPITEELEPLRLTDDSGVGDNDAVRAEAAEKTDQTQGAESQVEPVVVDVQPTEITEPQSLLDSIGALTVTQPELLDAAIHVNETSKLESKTPASPSAIMGSAEALTPTEVSNNGVQAVAVEEPIAQTQTAEEQKEIEPPEVDVLENKVTEPGEQESAPEITERTVIRTHPVLLDVGIYTAETIDPVANAPYSSTVTADEIETLKPMDVLGSNIQIEQAGSTQKADSQKQSELPETSLQAAEITEPEANFDLTQIAGITTQPVLLDDSLLYTIKTVELEIEEAEDEEINPVDKVTSSIQSIETNQSVCQTKKEDVFLSEPLPCDQQTKVTKEHVHNPEEENDQDVWLDAEEGDYTQEETEMSFLEVEEHLESMAESMPEEEARFEEEVEIDPNVQTDEEEESQQEEYKTGEVCEIESEGEGEDFAIALEHQEYATASISTIKWD